MNTLNVVLMSVIALDHALAQVPGIASNSTAQLIFNIIGSLGSALLGLFSSKN